jgi:hypothetical protein
MVGGIPRAGFSSETMKQDAAFFADGDPRLIYIAKTLRDALRLEGLLTEAGVDYGVEADRYTGGVVFRTERTGAFFYVLPDAAELALRVMQENGYKPVKTEAASPEGS